jgi:hypothetical protein
VLFAKEAILPVVMAGSIERSLPTMQQLVIGLIRADDEVSLLVVALVLINMMNASPLRQSLPHCLLDN